MTWKSSGPLVILLAFGCKSLDPIPRQDGGSEVDLARPDPGMLPDVPPPEKGPGDPGNDEAAEEAGEDQDVPADPEPVDGPADVQWYPQPRECRTTFRFKPPVAATSVTVPGEWNAWDRAAHPMKAGADGTWSVELGPGDVPVGSFGYKFCVDGCPDAGWYIDPENPLVKYVDGVENSKVVFPDCSVPELELVSSTANFEARKIEVVVRVRAGAGGEAPDLVAVSAEYRGERLQPPSFSIDPTGDVSVKLEGLEPGKHSLVFRASNASGEAEPLFVPLWLEARPFTWRDATMYFAMTDRFANGDKGNDGPAAGPGGEPCLQPGSKADWLGGDFAGLRQKVEEGWFDALGVNAIWISAANDNPDGCYTGDLGYSYSAYHAYFPLTLDTVEGHFGTLDDLKALTAAAHARGIRVLMDFAANHVHADSPIWQQHKDWFHQSVLLCGEGNNWNEHPVDCWFQPYLPDLDFTNDEAVEAFTAAAVWWAREADLDGFRVDAVKHLDPVAGTHAFVRALRQRLKAAVETTGVPFYMVGETFVGDWGGGTGDEKTIKAYVSPLELDGQFNFPLYWSLLDAFARGQGDMGGVLDVLVASTAYFGPDSIMSNFLGNHDVPRFMSHAAGAIADKWGNGSKEQGWNAPPPLPSTPEPFLRMRMAFAFLMTVPGIPLLYYGDEVGLPGAGDPDNRRMMQFDGLSPEQSALLDAVRKLGKARAAHPATREGQVVKIKGEKDFVAYAVVTTGDAVVVALNRGDLRTETLSLPQGVPTTVPLHDILTGQSVTATGGKVTVEVPRLGAVVLAP